MGHHYDNIKKEINVQDEETQSLYAEKKWGINISFLKISKLKKEATEELKTDQKSHLATQGLEKWEKEIKRHAKVLV